MPLSIDDGPKHPHEFIETLAFKDSADSKTESGVSVKWRGNYEGLGKEDVRLSCAGYR